MVQTIVSTIQIKNLNITQKDPIEKIASSKNTCKSLKLNWFKGSRQRGLH